MASTSASVVATLQAPACIHSNPGSPRKHQRSQGQLQHTCIGMVATVSSSSTWPRHVQYVACQRRTRLRPRKECCVAAVAYQPGKVSRAQFLQQWVVAAIKDNITHSSMKQTRLCSLMTCWWTSSTLRSVRQLVTAASAVYPGP